MWLLSFMASNLILSVWTRRFLDYLGKPMFLTISSWEMWLEHLQQFLKSGVFFYCKTHCEGIGLLIFWCRSNGILFMIRRRAWSWSLSDNALEAHEQTSNLKSYQVTLFRRYCYNGWLPCCNPESSIVYQVLLSLHYCAYVLKFKDIWAVHKSLSLKP